MRMLLDMDDEPWDDEWKQVLTAMMNWYDINLWRDDITDKCIAQCMMWTSTMVSSTDTTDWLRLWWNELLAL